MTCLLSSKSRRVLTAAVLLGAFTTAWGADRVPLAGHVPGHLREAAKVDHVSSGEMVSLGLVVRLDQALLTQTLANIYDRGPNLKKHYLTSSEFAQRFNLAEKRQALKEFSRAQGLQVDS